MYYHVWKINYCKSDSLSSCAYGTICATEYEISLFSIWNKLFLQFDMFFQNPNPVFDMFEVYFNISQFLWDKYDSQFHEFRCLTQCNICRGNLLFPTTLKFYFQMKIQWHAFLNSRVLRRKRVPWENVSSSFSIMDKEKINFDAQEWTATTHWSPQVIDQGNLLTHFLKQPRYGLNDGQVGRTLHVIRHKDKPTTFK